MRRTPRHIWKEVLTLHKAERNGFIILVALILAVCAWITYEHNRPMAPQDKAALIAEVDSWIAQRTLAEGKAVDPLVVLDPAQELFAFDPNTTTVEEWMLLGLSEGQAKGVVRYGEVAGGFRYRQDLERIRSIRPEQYERMHPFIQLPDRPERKERPGKKENARREPFPVSYEERPAQRVVEVNTSDSIALVGLRGIGPAFSKGILAYRELLGGYYSLDQLEEVYVLRDKPESIAKLKTLLVVDTLMIRRIPINSCTAERLAAHPYVSWKIANAIVAYRQHHGPFPNTAALSGCILVDSTLLRKLAPYCTVE